MKKFFKNKLFKRSIISLSLLGLIVFSFAAYKLQANPDVLVTAATGGDAISIDTTSFSGGTHTGTALGNIVIQEGAVGDIALGNHTLTAPEGWNFTNDIVTISVGGGDRINSGQ